MQTAVHRVLRVGRATMLAIGVGVSLALVLGAATVALAAVPGDPFKLGKVNIIGNATTALQGGAPNDGALLHLKRDAGSGPALKVENQSGGLGGHQGIRIDVPPGHAPIQANFEAGKSALNVTQLDGKDEQDFLSASRLYGKTALKTGPGGGAEVNFRSFDGSEGLSCDDGDVALDASANANDINDDLNDIVRESRGSYFIQFQDNGSAGGLFRASITCSDSSKPFRE
jgi:hypothetical protein